MASFNRPCGALSVLFPTARRALGRSAVASHRRTRFTGANVVTRRHWRGRGRPCLESPPARDSAAGAQACARRTPVRLAEVLVRTNLDLAPELAPWRRDALRSEPMGSGATRPIPGGIRALEPLLADASLAGEVELRRRTDRAYPDQRLERELRHTRHGRASDRRNGAANRQGARSAGGDHRGLPEQRRSAVLAARRRAGGLARTRRQDCASGLVQGSFAERVRRRLRDARFVVRCQLSYRPLISRCRAFSTS